MEQPPSAPFRIYAHVEGWNGNPLARTGVPGCYEVALKASRYTGGGRSVDVSYA